MKKRKTKKVRLSVSLVVEFDRELNSLPHGLSTAAYEAICSMLLTYESGGASPAAIEPGAKISASLV